MSWTKKQIKQHKKAAKALNDIINELRKFIGRDQKTTDLAVRQFVKRQYKKYHLKSDKQGSIVAFGSDTSQVHFYANEPRQLKPGDLILVDIWARLAKIGAPFADITWMMYYGRKLPKPYAQTFRLVARARDKAVEFIKRNLKRKVSPIGKEIDAVVRNYLDRQGQGEKFLHGTGHSLGFTNPHGKRTRINRRGRRPLPLNVGYTIEPGVYFNNDFGLRSEIDFYIDENYKLLITTKLQKKIIKI